MQQILLHPGFHRTGTSAMQHFMWLNRDALAPYLSLMMLRHMKPAVQHCGKFSETKNPLDLMDLIRDLDAAFSENPVPQERNLIMSCEALIGATPGRGSITDYSAAPVLVEYLAGYLSERFPNAQVRVIMTTRAADDWLFSLYRNLLRFTRLTLSREEFGTKYADAANFDTAIDTLAKAIEPIEVLYLPLELALKHPKGPGGALVDQFDIPSHVMAGLERVGRGNEGPEPHMWGQFLSLNRSALDDAEVAKLKAAMADTVQLGAWKKA